MPKNSADSHEMEAVLEVYKSAGTWLTNANFILELKNKLGEPFQEPQAYTKKTQISSYFGFITFEDPSDNRSPRKITESGRRFYDGIKNKNKEAIFEEIIYSLKTKTFGRNVCGLDSDSDIEPPKVFIRCALILNYLTRKEFAYILFKLEDNKELIFQIISDIATARMNGLDNFGDLPNGFLDAKPITALVNWEFLITDGKVGQQDRLVINPIVVKKYLNNLASFNIFNNEPLTSVSDKNNTSFLQGGKNLIYFGSPGSGKSFKAKNDAANGVIYTTLFHPEYTYSDFLGSYRPVIGHEIDQPYIEGYDGIEIAKPVNYFEFVPGPLINALSWAYENPGLQVFLLIDELNRGECASIFGDIFQLLDRDSIGTSEYGLTLRAELKKYFLNRGVDFDIKGDGKLYFPSNFSLIATINTSDQSLYPIDAAFKRRWEWVFCPINFDILNLIYPNSEIILHDGRKDWFWIKLLVEINKRIILNNMEDKQIGPWFIKPEDDLKINYKTFLNKCLFYLWHDVFKDDQSSSDSPFRLEDGISTFGALQEAMVSVGLEAGFNKSFLQQLTIIDSTNSI